MPAPRALFAALVLAAAPLAAQAGSPAGQVPAEALAARRAALARIIGTGVAIVRSAEERSIEGDYPQDSDYRENNDFFYLTGLEAPGGWVAIAAKDSAVAEVRLFIPPRQPGSEQWTGPKLGPDSVATRLSGIAQVHSADSAEALLQRFVFQPNGPGRTGGVYLAKTEKALEDDFLRRLFLSSLNVRDVRPVTAQLRLVKDADEIARLRRSIDITAEAHREAMRAAKPGMWEYELEAIIEGTFRRRGAERVGFPSIVGSGPNSTVLHYDKSRRQTAAGDLVVMDIGAEYGYYSADVTRTIPISGKFSERQRRIYELVLATQQVALDSTRPGRTLGQLGQIARDYMEKNSGDLCGERSCVRYFIHGLSHWLGMDVHDVGAYTTPLAPGMVFTIEPGIYIPEENLGVRIEDDILVTPSGGENLSAGAPRTVAEIERAMR
ncbi:MAG TPA: aminopeptidase P N-terminal domain-containing protein [Gemmatimonadales bacterium]